MKKFFHEAAIKKLLAYKRKYPDNPAKCAIKICGYCAAWAVKSILPQKVSRKDKQNFSSFKVAFRLTNMIGDVLVNLNYLKGFSRHLPENCILDIYSGLNEEVIDGLFYGNDFINQFIKGKYPDKGKYDLVVDLDRYPEILYCSDRINSENNHFLSEYVKIVSDFNMENPVFLLYGSWAERVGIEYARLFGRTRHTQGDIHDFLNLKNVKYSLKANPEFKRILDQNGLEKKRYITFQRGIAGAGEYTRLWSLENYKAVVNWLKNSYPEYRLVQLGRTDTLEIEGIDLDLRGKTSFEELKNILKYALIHIDGDCGMVHVRHYLQGGISIVLFGPTSPDYIGYPENINLRADGCPGFCEWISNDWQEKCIRGYKDLPCMVKPEIVIEKIKSILEAD